VQTNKERKESMKNLENKLIEIFCHIDDFNQVFIKELQTHQLTDGTRVRIKPCSLNEQGNDHSNLLPFNALKRLQTLLSFSRV
jgi:hypothetical protein